MDTLWFFLSHARRDNIGDGYCKRFFDRLADEVARAIALKSGVHSQECGFFDETTIEQGDIGTPAMAQALQTCRVLVSLYSPSYFQSEWCGREFQIFSQRIEAHVKKQNSSERPPVVLPILWSRPSRFLDSLPSAITKAGVQFKNDAFAEVYREQGLEYIIRLGKRYQDELEDFLIKFAERLVDVANAHCMEPLRDPPSLDTVKSAFHVQADPVPATLPVNITGGMNVAHFICLAGSRDELQSVKQKAECYSVDGGRFWRPYHPEFQRSVGAVSAMIAGEEDLQPEYLPLSKSLMEQIREAETNSTIVVIIVDPWTLCVDTYRAYMENYDQYNFRNCGVLILWNDNDEETQQKKIPLQQNLDDTLLRNLEERNPYVRLDIRSSEQFQKELRIIMAGIRGRLLTKGKVHRPVELGQVLPLVSGPGAF